MSGSPSRSSRDGLVRPSGPIQVPKGKLAVTYVFGVSSKNSDGDNLIKAFQDALAVQYGFNDRDIYHWDVEKRIVAKGEEFVGFRLLAYDPHVRVSSRKPL
jgi:hypothetical protein